MARTRILIVEDNLLIAMEIEQALESHGAEVTTCLSVAEASAALTNASYDFVLSDYVLDQEPVLPLLGLAAARNIPVALLTGYSAEHLSQIPAEMKVFEKPFREEDIVAHVADTCGDPGFDDADEYDGMEPS